MLPIAKKLSYRHLHSKGLLEHSMLILFHSSSSFFVRNRITCLLTPRFSFIVARIPPAITQTRPMPKGTQIVMTCITLKSFGESEDILLTNRQANYVVFLKSQTTVVFKDGYLWFKTAAKIVHIKNKFGCRQKFQAWVCIKVLILSSLRSKN